MARTIFCILAALILSVASAVQALPVDRNLLQFKHSRWTTDDGAPANIRALAQSNDGYLWLGSSSGLYRFDGRVFEQVPLIGAETTVMALLTARNGDLWVGLQNGHILLLRDGRQSDVTPSVHAKRVAQFVEDATGHIWVRTVAYDLQLARYSNGKWNVFGPTEGVPGLSSIILKAVATRDGALWLLTQKAVRVLRPGDTKFTIVMPVADSVDDIAADHQGHLWLADDTVGIRPLVPTAAARPIAFVEPKSAFRHLMFDNAGAVWGAVNAHGLFRGIVLPVAGGTAIASVQRYGREQGLSSDSIGAILQDREGNIWAGTSIGLDRFRAANVVQETAIPAQSRYGFIVFSDRRGIIYVADSDTLYRVLPGGKPKPVLRNIENPGAICEFANGDILVIAWKSAFRIHDGVASPLAGMLIDRNFLRCQGDRNGNIWALTPGGEFLQSQGNGWVTIPGPKKTPDQIPTGFAFDAAGRAVVFYENWGLVRFDPSRFNLLLPFDSLPGGRVGPLYQGRSSMLLGAVAGLVRIRNGQVAQYGRSIPWLRHVTGLVQTTAGETWLQSSTGIFRVSTSALEDAFQHPDRQMKAAKFDVQDGLPGANLIDYADNGAALGADGRLWFTTTNGIVWIDPARLERNALPPPVDIKRIIADGVTINDPIAIDLAKGTKSLEIDYTALSLTMPERIAFRYRMEGVDDRWTDPGTRRQAFYANLVPGNYRFTVIASNNDGVWNTTGASVSLILPPTFLQSWMFKLLCAVAVLVAVWVVYRLRLNTMTGRLRTRLEGRLAERERIARDLHDTLLQGVHGLILRFQGIADRLPREQVLGRLMEKALERAEELLVEGRERVHDLRSGLLPDDLRAAITSTAMHADIPQGIVVDIRQTGIVRDVDPVARDEMIWIVREALLNVVRHADATRIDIALAYRWNRLAVSISDNGRGLSPLSTLPEVGRHYGVTGMRERAQRIAATLELGDNVDGAGTRLMVMVPGRSAYPADPGRRLRTVLGLSTTGVTA